MHGLRYLPEYQVWLRMKQRCTNPKDISYKNYGGRGIKICDRWMKSFRAFYEDMGARPVGYSIDRVNNDRDYSPENCKWVSRSAQSINRRMMKSNKSGYRGVSYHKLSEKWRVQISLEGRKFWFGLYNSPEEAAFIYNQVAPQLHGSNAMLNL